MLDAAPPTLLTCLEAKKLVIVSISGQGQEPSLVKVRPVALFLITELDSVAVQAAGSPSVCS